MDRQPDDRTERVVTVLIVDDSATVRGRLRDLVDEVVDVRVVGEAGGLLEARAMLAAMRPEVVVLDLRLGDGNGLELLRELEHDALAPRVIVLTNDAWPHYRRECLAAGAEWFFDKTTEFHRVPEVLASQAFARARHEASAGSVDVATAARDAGATGPEGPGGHGVVGSAAVGARGADDVYGTGARAAVGQAGLERGEG